MLLRDLGETAVDRFGIRRFNRAGFGLKFA